MMNITLPKSGGQDVTDTLHDYRVKITHCTDDASENVLLDSVIVMSGQEFADFVSAYDGCMDGGSQSLSIILDGKTIMSLPRTLLLRAIVYLERMDDVQ